jgi:hypothetical protein
MSCWIILWCLSNSAIPSLIDDFDPDSNVTEERDNRHQTVPTFKFSHQISTDERTTISINAVPLNAHFSIRDNIDRDSNVSEVGDVHATAILTQHFNR